MQIQDRTCLTREHFIGCIGCMWGKSAAYKDSGFPKLSRYAMEQKTPKISTEILKGCNLESKRDVGLIFDTFSC